MIKQTRFLMMWGMGKQADGWSLGKGRLSKNLNLYIDNEEIEIVTNYKYLVIVFSRSGSFLATRKYTEAY